MKQIVLVIGILIFILSACSGNGTSSSDSSNEKNDLPMGAALLKIAINDSEVDEVIIEVTASDIDTISSSLSIINDTAVGIIENLLEGIDRKFEVRAFKGNMLSHYGDTLADIIDSDTTEIQVSLNALYGSADIAIPISENLLGSIDSIYVRAIGGRDTLSITLDSGYSYTGQLNSIPVGDSIEYFVYVVSEGEIKYESRTKANLTEGEVVEVVLNTNPIVGTAEIIASINSDIEWTVTGNIGSSKNNVKMPLWNYLSWDTSSTLVTLSYFVQHGVSTSYVNSDSVISNNIPGRSAQRLGNYFYDFTSGIPEVYFEPLNCRITDTLYASAGFFLTFGNIDGSYDNIYQNPVSDNATLRTFDISGFDSVRVVYSANDELRLKHEFSNGDHDGFGWTLPSTSGQKDTIKYSLQEWSQEGWGNAIVPDKSNLVSIILLPKDPEYGISCTNTVDILFGFYELTYF